MPICSVTSWEGHYLLSQCSSAGTLCYKYPLKYLGNWALRCERWLRYGNVAVLKKLCGGSFSSGSDLRRAIALARHRAPKCCTRRVIFSAPWSTHKQTRSKESDFSLSYSSLCPPKESDLSLSCHFQNLSTAFQICEHPVTVS